MVPSPQVSWLFFKARATSISRLIRKERATRKNSQPAHGLEGCVENGPAAALLVGYRFHSDMRPPRALPTAHFERNPPGRGRLAVFPRCSLLTYRSRYARRLRLEKQPTDLRRWHHYMRDGTPGWTLRFGSRFQRLFWIGAVPRPSA